MCETRISLPSPSVFTLSHPAVFMGATTSQPNISLVAQKNAKRSPFLPSFSMHDLKVAGGSEEGIPFFLTTHEKFKSIPGKRRRPSFELRFPAAAN